MSSSGAALVHGGGGGGGTTVQVIDQRSKGAPVQIERGVDSSGREQIRAIIRDEVADVYEQTARQRNLETISAVKNGQKRGAFFGG
jgi:hypothetical protein